MRGDEVRNQVLLFPGFLGVLLEQRLNLSYVPMPGFII